jgi:hypothetical protein
MKILLILAGLSLAAPTMAQQPQAPTATQTVPVRMEYYYRIKWGAADQFKKLYAANHAPLLEDMKKAGFITAIRVEEPFTHMAGGPRWDLRVTIDFKDAAAAIADPRWDKLWDEAKKRRYQDQARFEAEEAQRFALLEDHWDIVVNEVQPKP